MHHTLFLVIFLYNLLYSQSLYQVPRLRDTSNNVNGVTDDTLLDQPSCSRLNGVCAVIGNCPPGTRIELRGLCPDEEQYGMECCIPFLSIPALQAPFFELPCMRIGGTCAKAFACPTGTRVGRKGLCPDQQELGIECCRPTNTEKTCIFINGVCMASADECPEIMQIEGTSDCKHDEICCIYNQ
ncbi:hypothetical protein HF086_011374 [Spodoptera exigua]|uniref:Uncharacterized protein n=1 Tax=Spodoptera exigua TaxID=7107 RepID=A0A922ML28_SPOEX|nr:hypothetical protein HF086_011374 [Spodoptera exigua]